VTSRKQAFVTALAVCVTITEPAIAGSGNRLDRTNFVLTFEDTFGSRIDFFDRTTGRGRWKTNYFYGDQHGASSRTANDEIVVDPEYAGIAPITLVNGIVHMKLEATTSTDPRLAGKKLTAGLLTTERSFVQKYGYFEARLATPAVPGCWPAFWLYSAPVTDLTRTQAYGEWTGGLDNEIDVVEVMTKDTHVSFHTAHNRFYWKSIIGGERKAIKFEKQAAIQNSDTSMFHNYGVLWTEENIVWYVDDIEVARVSNPGIHDPMYMILSMGAGGWAGSGNILPPAFKEAEMLVDEVRAFRLAPRE